MGAEVFWYESPPEPPWNIGADEMVGPIRFEGELFAIRSGFLGLSTVYVVKVRRFRVGDTWTETKDMIRETSHVNFCDDAA